MRAFVVFTLSVILLIGTPGFDPLGMIRFEEIVQPGNELVVYVNAVNTGNRDLDNVKISAYIPELVLFSRTRSFDLEENGKHAKVLLVDIPYNTPKGSYLMQIFMQNENDFTFRSREFRYVWIV